jgi:hypothetical protein
MVSGNWIIGVIGALSTAAALILGKVQGRKEASAMVINEPVPTVPTSKVFTPPTWDAHRALVDRVTAVEHITQELRRDMAVQYREIMMAGGERETRLTDKLDHIASAIHSRIDDLMMEKKTRKNTPV